MNKCCEKGVWPESREFYQDKKYMLAWIQKFAPEINFEMYAPVHNIFIFYGVIGTITDFLAQKMIFPDAEILILNLCLRV